MDAEVAVLLADGFEEIEAITIIDTLRRADITVQTISVSNSLAVMGGHDIEVKSDTLLSQVSEQRYKMVVLPGGGKGVQNLEKAALVKAFLLNHTDSQIAAICAAPSLLARFDLLKGKRAAVYPGFENVLKEHHAIIENKNVITDGNVTTSRGPGTALQFSLALVEKLRSATVANELAQKMLVTAPD